MRSLLYENWTPFKRISNMILLQLLGKRIARSPPPIRRAGNGGNENESAFIFIRFRRKLPIFCIQSCQIV